MKRLLSLFFLSILFLLYLSPTLSQSLGQIEVKRSVNFRREPTKANEPIELLRAPEKLKLIDPQKRRGYYHVQDANGQEGWVWARNVRLVANTLAMMADPSEPMGAGVTQHISTSWQKFVPTKSTFIGTEGPCAAEGNGSDPDQYILKNRNDVPPAYHDVTVGAVDDLPFPGKGVNKKAPTNRKDWLPEHFAITNPYESMPIRVEGYILVIRDQTNSEPGKGEGTNCGFGKLGDIDAHIALVKSPTDPESKAVVVEWTPRFTQLHPKWTSKKLAPWINTGKKVRISGWLMIDPNHLTHITGVKINGQLRKFRSTLWEIHPITKIEVEVNGSFVDLDGLP